MVKRYVGNLRVNDYYNGYFSPTLGGGKLVFPLTQLPLEMLRGADEGIFPRLFRNPLMWVGFSSVCNSNPGLNHYFFFVPKIDTLFEPLRLFRNSVSL